MNIIYSHLTDQRLSRFAYAFSITQHEALGFIASFWLRSQENFDVEVSLAKVHHYLPVQLPQERYELAVRALCAAGYLDKLDGNKFSIVDNAEPVRIRECRQKAAIKARMMNKQKRQQVKAALPPKRVPDASKPKRARNVLSEESKMANSLTWSAYAKAFTGRYNTVPTRNARVNSLIAQFVKRVGNDDAGYIAEFYLSINSKEYIKSWHPWNLAVRDCETLRAQWQTNSTNSETEQKMRARQADYMESQRRIAQEFDVLDFVYP